MRSTLTSGQGRPRTETLTAHDVFDGLAMRLGPLVVAEFGQGCCILATRIAIEVAAYFGVTAKPVPTRVIAWNAAFAPHVDEGDCDVRKWTAIDGSYSVGVGFGFVTPGAERINSWNGHLVAAGEGWFGDFSIQQVERPAHGLITGPAVVGPYDGQPKWVGTNERGVHIAYERILDHAYLRAPDWRDERRRRFLVAKLIREIRAC